MLDSSGPLSNTSAHLIAVRLKGANRQIFRAFLRIASATLLIRVMGMVSQIVISGHFGAGATMDAYFVASGLPLLLASLLTSAIDGSVIPVYVRTRRKDQSSALFSTMLNLLLISIIVLTLILIFFRQQAIFLVAPALDPFRKELAVSLTPVIFPVLLVMVVNGFLECLLNAEGQFGWPAYAGIAVPFTITLLVLVLGSTPGVVILCIGTLIGQCLQLGVLIVRAYRAGFAYRPVIHLRHPALGMILIAALPELFDGLISQAGPIIDQIFASFLTAGSISALSYSLKLVSVFSGVIFAATGQAALPYLSRQATIRDMDGFKATLRLYLWAVAIGTTILAAFVLLLAHPLVQILFQRGAFTAVDTDRTARTLMGFTIGLTPMAFGFIVSRAFSALRKNFVLLYVTIFSVFANAVFDYIFVRLWQSFGIALATSAVYFCTMFILLFTLRHMIGGLDLFTLPREFREAIGRIGNGKRRSGFMIPYTLRQQIVRLAIAMAIFAVAAYGVILNYVYALRAALGSVIILIFLRYRYALLITWVGLDALIGSTLPIFSGNNLLSGLTIPTLLLMFAMPIKQTFKRMPAIFFFSLYLLWVFASIGISAIGVSAFLTLWLTFVDYLAVAVLVINVLTSRRHLLGLIDAILLEALFISLYGLYSYITKQNGVTDLATSLFRTGSVFGAAPTLAFFLSMIIPLSLYRTLTLKGFKRVGSMIVFLIFLLTFILTFTRGAYISVLLSIIIMVFFLPSRRLRIGILSSIIVGGVFIALISIFGDIPIFSRFFNQDITTLNGRTYLWQALLQHFDPTQLLGNGLQASDVLLTNLRVSILGNVIDTAPHNLFLEALYNHGIIGLSLLTLVLITLAFTILKGIQKTTGEHRLMYAMALAVFINVLVQSFEVTVIWNQEVGTYFWLIMAMPFALCWSVPKQASKTIENEAIFDLDTETQMEAIQQVERERIYHV